MLEFDADKLLFTIPAGHHGRQEVTEILGKHPEVQYVSFVGIDLGGHDTDEKIPVQIFLEDMDKMLSGGVQTDGSSVSLPGIASLSNAKIDIVPDSDVNWYVDYNRANICHSIGDLPVGTLRIPAFLVHNNTFACDSRSVLLASLNKLKEGVMKELREHPYLLNYINGIDSPDDIDHLVITSATELEFWVKTPDDRGDREQLFTSQVLKEQYWKRTYGQVRTALEDTLLLMDRYGFGVEMGHKEVGGVKAHMAATGKYDHVMEQLEIDWHYAGAMQAADNENMVKYVVRDTFTRHGLDVTFMAKPFKGVAGSGEHTHIGLAAKLKNGKIISMFAPADPHKDFLNPIGYGSIMGLLKNYEVLNPFISATNDAFNRLKPGFEAPVCTVTSLGVSVESPSRNRSILAGLIRDINNPLATRFELRAPNAKSNTYLTLASSYQAMLDGIHQVSENEKTPKELEKSISKSCGEEDFYLEKDREYRSEKNIFVDYSEEEREKRFGKAPATVWENLQAFKKYPDKMKIFDKDVFPEAILDSYYQSVLSQWKTELHDRLIPGTMDILRSCKKLHTDDIDYSDCDVKRWNEIDVLRREIGKDTLRDESLLSKTRRALDEERYDDASNLQMEVQRKVELLQDLYEEYKKNLF
ncbi:MAG: glutamine synthetase [Eubacteriales bacterium]|nr:glutamine synthetase [Eubacteriales bacterium]